MAIGSVQITVEYFPFLKRQSNHFLGTIAQRFSLTAAVGLLTSTLLLFHGHLVVGSEDIAWVPFPRRQSSTQTYRTFDLSSLRSPIFRWHQQPCYQTMQDNFDLPKFGALSINTCMREGMPIRIRFLLLRLHKPNQSVPCSQLFCMQSQLDFSEVKKKWQTHTWSAIYNKSEVTGIWKVWICSFSLSYLSRAIDNPQLFGWPSDTYGGQLRGTFSTQIAMDFPNWQTFLSFLPM